MPEPAIVRDIRPYLQLFRLQEVARRVAGHCSHRPHHASSLFCHWIRNGGVFATWAADADGVDLRRWVTEHEL